MQATYRRISSAPQTSGISDLWKGMSQDEKAMFDQLNASIRDMQININSLNSNNTFLRESNDSLTKRVFELERLRLPAPSAPPSAPTAVSCIPQPTRFRISS